MSILRFYKGRTGDPGINGINGLSSTDVNSSELENPILDCLQYNELSKNAYLTLTRNTVDSFINRYGKGEFSKPASATNFVPYSEDFSQWDDVLSAFTIIGSTTDPNGGSDATEIELDTDTRNIAGTIPVMGDVMAGLTAGKCYVASFYIKLISGAIDYVDYAEDSTYYNAGPITTSWKRISVKTSSNSTSSRFGISPRGDSGARFAVYGVQFEQDTLTDYIKTTGAPKTATLTEDNKRTNTLGYLIEDQKQNLCHNTTDFAGWSIDNGTFTERQGADVFGFNSQKTRIVFSSIPIITCETTTESLTEGQEYTVSFYAFMAGGSLSSLSISLGGGESVALSNPSVVGFTRIVTKATAGPDDTLSLTVHSPSLSAQFNACCFQVEEGESSSYIQSGSIGQTRSLDLLSMDYAYNAPLPSGSWTFVFNQYLEDNSDKKTIFSNGESGVNEFSLYFEDQVLTLNMGGNLSTATMLQYSQIAISYDGSDVKFYANNQLIKTVASSSTSFISATMYLGSNGTDEAANGHLSGLMFYNTELTINDLLYLMGDK